MDSFGEPMQTAEKVPLPELRLPPSLQAAKKTITQSAHLLFWHRSKILVFMMQSDQSDLGAISTPQVPHLTLCPLILKLLHCLPWASY